MAALSKRGWNVRPAATKAFLLPRSVATRYPTLPNEVIDFLASVEICSNQTKDAWLLTAEDYARPASQGFRWNEYEHMALETLTDPQERAAVSHFWDSHFPFMLAVHSDYDYLAIQLTSDSKGSVVHGYAPDWGKPRPIAQTFAEFVDAFTIAAAEADPAYPLKIFL